MNRRVYGCGPEPCSLLFMGERPGQQEIYYGTPFVGKTGKELDRYLWNMGLDRHGVYLDNLVKDRAGNRDTAPTPDEIRRDEPDNVAMLDRVRPDIIVTLGLHSTRYFLGPDASLERDHAIPRVILWRPRFVPSQARTYTIFPIYHIAAGFHQPEMQPLIDYDFQCLDAFLRGVLPSPEVDQHINTRYVLATPDDMVLLKSTLEARPLLPVALDTEGWPGDEWGLSISVTPGEALVFTRQHHAQSDFDNLNQLLQGRKILLHNSLHDIGILRTLGINVTNFVDTMVMAYLLQVEAQGLKPLSYRHSGMDMQDYTDVVAPYAKDLYIQYLEQVNDIAWPPGEGRKHGINKRVQAILKAFAKGEVKITDRWKALGETYQDMIVSECGPLPDPGLKHVPLSVAVPYSARDADATFRLYPKLERRIASLGLEKVLALDLSIIPMVDAMQSHGMLVDRNRMSALGTRLDSEMLSIVQQSRTITNEPEFNIGSGPQVAAFLFDTLNLDPVKLTKSRARGSVDDKAIEELKLKHCDHGLALAFMNLRSDFMERQKLKGTYVKKLPRFIGPDGRIHPHFRITRVVSGRFASFDPNILAIPVRTELGRLVRSGFVAGPGRVLGSWDLDQIEMRVLAHESQDPGMIEVLSDPSRHIHKETTFRIFGIPVAQVDKESWQYMSSKNISFGIVYGITSEGLRAQMAQRGQFRTLEECQRMIDDYLTKAYPGVRDYMDRCTQQAYRYGFVRDFLGRIRYLPGIHSSIASVRSEAERAAGNHPIQAGATTIMKLWLRRVWHNVCIPGLADPLIPVHDEIVLEFDKQNSDVIDSLVRQSLQEAVEPLHYSVPIRCGGKTADNWGGLK